MIDVDVLSYHRRFGTVIAPQNIQAVKTILAREGIMAKTYECLSSRVQRIRIKPDYKDVTKLLKLEKGFQCALNDNRVTVTMNNGFVDIDIPHDSFTVLAGDLIRNMPNDGSLVLPIGMNMGKKVITYSLDKMPHMLVAGCTGSGKSIFLNVCITALLMKDVDLILVDPKRVEFSPYDGCHGVKVLTDADNAIKVLHDLNTEMNRRYDLFAKVGCRDIDSYNASHKPLRKIVLVVDELSQLMSGKDKKAIETDIVKIAQLSRAAGIHMILATQYPISSVVTGLIKQNIPCKVCFQTTNQTGSVVMIGRKGAEKLLGKGDMLFVSPETDIPVRLQGGYITSREIQNVANSNRNNRRRLFGGWK